MKFLPPDEQRSRTMRAVKSEDTGPEWTVRRAVHALGYRYRLHAPDLPGKPDLVLRSRRKVIFVHGCFWHGHTCARGARMPVRNREYWTAKIARNHQRDLANVRKLRGDGWKVLVVWECQTREEEKLQSRLKKFLEQSA